MTHLAFELRTSTPDPVPARVAARRLGERPGLLEPWRDTVDEVVLVPVSADEEGPVRELADAALAAF